MCRFDFVEDLEISVNFILRGRIRCLLENFVVFISLFFDDIPLLPDKNE